MDGLSERISGANLSDGMGLGDEAREGVREVGLFWWGGGGRRRGGTRSVQKIVASFYVLRGATC